MNICMICTLWTPFQAERDWKNSYREILLIPLYIFYSLWIYHSKVFSSELETLKSWISRSSNRYFGSQLFTCYGAVHPFLHVMVRYIHFNMLWCGTSIYTCYGAVHPFFVIIQYKEIAALQVAGNTWCVYFTLKNLNIMHFIPQNCINKLFKARSRM